jgi:hypothetical protein
MTTATKMKDKPHSRIYTDWLRLPAWKNISPHARALLVEMLTGYRLGTNGTLEWPQSRVAKLLGCGNIKAADTLVELEKAGWIEITRAGAFAGARPSTLYRLTKYDCSVTGDPASHAYLTAFVPPRRVLKRNPTGANQKLAGCCQSSKQVLDSGGSVHTTTPVLISETLRKSLVRKGLIPNVKAKAG